MGRLRAAISRLPDFVRAVYVPSPPPAYVGPLITVGAAAVSLARGSQLYVIGAQTETLAFVEEFGVERWGLAFMISGALLAIALISRGLLPLVLAHLVGAAAYVGYLVSVVQGSLRAEQPTWQGIVTVAFGLVLHVARLDMFRRDFPAALQRTNQ